MILPSEIRKLPSDPPVRGFPGVWRLPLLRLPSPGWVSIPSSFVSLFIFYILFYLLLKTMGCFSGRLMSSASDQKLFCALFSVFKCSLDEFVRGESGLPVLFLCRFSSSPICFNSKKMLKHYCLSAFQIFQVYLSFSFFIIRFEYIHV